MSEKIRGYTDGSQFRDNNRYIDTQALFEELGLVDEVENRTPTVGVNIAHLAKMRSVQNLSREFAGHDLNVSILGISTAEGPRDLQRLLKGLGAGKLMTTAVDISNGIFEKVKEFGLDETVCLQKDARETGLQTDSQDIVLKDHLGNCCPPAIDRAIDKETVRILKPNGISIVNITTSELITDSKERKTVDFQTIKTEIGLEVIKALQSNIYDIGELGDVFGTGLDWKRLKGPIIEIEPELSFVVFGEDVQSHGEWFRSLADHLNLWQNDGFRIIDIKTRQGLDSHNPPLNCLRHNVILRKL